jgi:hypothetical protein
LGDPWPTVIPDAAYASPRSGWPSEGYSPHARSATTYYPGPYKPIGQLRAILAWHANLEERPAALDIAHGADELAAHRAHLCAQAAAHLDHERAAPRADAPLSRPPTRHSLMPQCAPRADRQNQPPSRTNY